MADSNGPALAAIPATPPGQAIAPPEDRVPPPVRRQAPAAPPAVRRLDFGSDPTEAAAAGGAQE
eukprot:gene5658-3680_t